MQLQEFDKKKLTSVEKEMRQVRNIRQIRFDITANMYPRFFSKLQII